MANAEVRTHLYSSPEYKTYDPSSADVNLITDRPGYNDASSTRMPCRAIYSSVAGTVVVRLNDHATDPEQGTSVTLTFTAGATLPVQAGFIESASTSTDITVMW